MNPFSRKIVFCVYVISLLFFFDNLIGRQFIVNNQRQFYRDKLDFDQKNRNRVNDTMYHHGLVPNTQVDYSWQNGEKYQLIVNSVGLVDQSKRQVQPNSSKYRILFLGDSFTEGVGYPYNQTFPSLLGKKYSAEKVEILNSGLQSYSPKIYFQKAKFLLDQMNVSVQEVVIMLDLSDMHNEFYWYRKFQPADYSDFQSTQLNNVEEAQISKFIGFFIDRSLICNILYERYVKIPYENNWKKYPYVSDYQAWTYDKTQFELYGKAGLEISADYLSDLIDFLRIKNVNKISLVVYPWRQQIEQKDYPSIQQTYWEAFSLKKNIMFIDLFPNFFKNQPVKNLYLPDSHFNGYGHKMVAEWLYESGVGGELNSVKEITP